MNDAAPAEPSAVKLALQARQIRETAKTVLAADPIAIIGMGCRLPGGADTPAQFWALLRDGVDAVGPVPPGRWDGDAWFDPDPATPGRSLARQGGFLRQIDGFDADYFGILPREADQMDPQQRLFLEVAIEAIDDAGLPHATLAGTRAGVFVASYHNDYAQLLYADPDAIDPRTLTGTLHSVLANRLSWLLDLRGPSLSVDTACSSSLVALHLACQSLRLGETDLAVAGGVSLMIAPGLMVSMSKVGFMAPDGRCKTFDAAADGFGRGEGCGALVLRRLSDALPAGDRILGVIRGTAVNQDGHSTVMAAPNGLAQQALIREALASAQVSPTRIGFVEAHGTGTALGDPIEVEAIAATIGRAFPGGAPCLLGSAKANLGHLEAAAGVAGVIKAVLALRHGAVPPQPHFRSLNPHLSLEGTRLAIPGALSPWPAGTVPRCAAISSFGVGGTNAHVIVEEAPVRPRAAEAGAGAAWILPLSARSRPALRDLAVSWAELLADGTAPVADLCHTASRRRTHHAMRLAVTGRTAAELRNGLARQLDGADAPLPAAPRRLAFVFTGQGPQWFGMGRELLAGEAVFRDVVAQCDALLRPLAGWSLLEELAQPEDRSRLHETERAQPALFAVQAGLAALWRSWGVIPDAVMGHSVGEIAALQTAGVLSLAEAMRIVCHRGRIMQAAVEQGRMAELAVDEAGAVALIGPCGAQIGIAAINAPGRVVLSGDTRALEGLLAVAAARGVAHRMLPGTFAFHSPIMALFQAGLVAALGQVAAGVPTIPVYSTVTGARCGDGFAFDAAYFARGLRAPVRFAAAVAAVAADQAGVFLELGPHPVLGPAIVETLSEMRPAPVVLASLRRGRPDRDSMAQAGAALYAAGRDPDWARLQPASGGVATLPAYPWQRRRHWISTRPLGPGPEAASHELLGERVAVAGTGIVVFTGSSAIAEAWLADHRVFGRVLLPGAAALEMLRAAASQAMGWPEPELTGFDISRPLVLPPVGTGAAHWQVVVTSLGENRVDLAVHGRDPAGDAAWIKVAGAIGMPGSRAATAPPSPGPTTDLRADLLHAWFTDRGVAFGPSFRCLVDSLAVGPGAAEAWVQLPDGLDPGTYGLHPVLLDAAIQLCSAAAGQMAPAIVFLPVAVDHLTLRPGSHRRLLARARVVRSGDGLLADLWLETASGAPVAEIGGLHLAPAAADQPGTRGSGDLYDVAWIPASPSGVGANVAGNWLVLGEQEPALDGIIQELRRGGGRIALVRAGDAFARMADREWQIDPGDPAGYRQVLAQAGPLRGIVHGWTLSPGPAEQADVRSVGAALHLVQALAAMPTGHAPGLWLLTRGVQCVTGTEAADMLRPGAAGLWGFAPVVRIEHPELAVRLRDLDPVSGPTIDLAMLLDAGAPSLAFRDGRPWMPRLRPYAAAPAGPVGQAVADPPGSLDGLGFRPLPHAPLRAGEVRVRVLAAGLNFRDVLMTLGLLPGAPVPLGVECAGIVAEVAEPAGPFQPGDRVFGFAPGSLGRQVVVPMAFLAPMPDGMRAEVAAGLSVAFTTAWHGLHGLAGLQAGERVLIHAAAGGVGLAAVQIARRAGAEVFATAGSHDKREMLRALGVRHVMDSRSPAFADEVLAATGGRGVDVVLNALAGDLIGAGFRVLAPGGRFLELGKRGIWTMAEAARTRPDVAYLPYDLGAAAQADPALLAPLHTALLAALADGSLQPLPVAVLPLERLGDAMRHMAQARHVGKIVLRVAPDPGRDGTLVSGTGTYWITGGLGGIGLDTAEWLVRSGARHLVLSGRQAAPDARAETRLAALRQAGARVLLRAADAGDATAMAGLLAEIDATLPALRGVVHAAGMLHDAPLVTQRWDAAREVLRGKAHGAWILHALLGRRPLDFLVLYSAAGLLLGAPGQGVYPAANAELDALAQMRRRSGLPTLSMAWGAWAGGGLAAARTEAGTDVWRDRGLGRILPADGFAQLSRLLADGAAHGALLPIDWRRFLAWLPQGADRAFFEAMAVREAVPRPSGTGQPALPATLRALPAAQRRPALLEALRQRMREVIGHDAVQQAGDHAPLRMLGLDSLMAVELRNLLVHAGGLPLPATLLFDHPTLDALATALARAWALEDHQPPAPPSRSAMPDPGSGIAALSEAEAEALLLDELALGTPEIRP